MFIPVHNRRDLIRAAIDSVLAQTFQDFELLIVDDGSTDGSADVAEAVPDERIRVVRQPDRLGIPKTRNHGLVLAQGEYLAILDSDDEALPGRLSKQVAFLERNREVAAVGGFALRTHRDGRAASPLLRPTGAREIRARILFTTCFKNPTMMARMDAMREFGYREEFVFCQDIDLWSRMSEKYPLANLPEFLTRYRLGGSSHGDDALSARLKKQVAEDQLRALGVAYETADLDRHYALRNPAKLSPDAAFVDWCEDWLLRLIDSNRANPCYPEPEFTAAAAERWWRVAVAARRTDVSIRRFFAQPRLASMLPSVLGHLASTGTRAASAYCRTALT